MNNSKKTIISLVVILIVIILVAVGIILGGSNSAKNPTSDNNPVLNSNASNSQDISNLPPIGSVPIGTSVPNKDSNTPSNVAKPDSVLPAAPGSDSSYRNFEIKAQGDKFSPDTIIVNRNDVITIKISAVDKNYDFTQSDYGLKINIPKGEIKDIPFQASASGKFTFFCSSCGGPKKGPIGYLIIK
ncbi:MAG: cupredoxin domain-containing protein [Candidatus Paceibacterota bacterium]|jgi:heme/copper-type cytochrome/quinol oxidase subunit 2